MENQKGRKLTLHQATLRNLNQNPFDVPMFGTNIISGCVACIPPSEVPSCQT